MPTIIMRGCSLGDDVFTTDPAVLGVTITWNVTRIRCDANAGKFGLPEEYPITVLPKLKPEAAANVDMSKVAGMVEAYKRGDTTAVDEPVLQVVTYIPHIGGIRLPVDGNHRLSARQALKLPHFHCFVVGGEIERHYRVTETVLP